MPDLDRMRDRRLTYPTCAARDPAADILLPHAATPQAACPALHHLPAAAQALRAAHACAPEDPAQSPELQTSGAAGPRPMCRVRSLRQ